MTATACRRLSVDAGLLTVGALGLGGLAVSVVLFLDTSKAVRHWYGTDQVRLTDLSFAEILLPNLHIMLGVFVLAWLVADPHWSRTAWDGLVALVLVGNVLVVSVALGAYGWLAVERVAPHGALELGALAVAGAAYLDARRAGWSLGTQASCAGLVVTLLAIAAAIESA